VLGARFGAFLGNPGARTLFLDGRAALAAGQGWTVSGEVRRGWTRVSEGGVRAGADRLTTMGWSAELNKQAVFAARDSFGLRIAQPLRVTSGGFDVTLPVSYDYATGQAGFALQRLNLAPQGRETDVEAYWLLPIRGGAVTANLFWRNQPGHIAASPNDAGGAIRFSLRY
jgi:hypothetical protein